MLNVCVCPQSWAAARYWEQAACALAATAPAHHSLAAYARRLAARHPANALLALGMHAHP